MAKQTQEQLNALFAPSSENGLPQEVMGELESILRLHSIPPQELFYKWESYSIKMGLQETKMDLDAAIALKKDINDALERELRTKAQMRSADKRAGATARNFSNSADVFGMLVFVKWDSIMLGLLIFML
jgi:DNA polymerase alpha subunit B